MYQGDLSPFVIALVGGFRSLSLESTSNFCLLQMDFLRELLYPSVRQHICSVILILVDVLLKAYGRHMTYRAVRGMRFFIHPQQAAGSEIEIIAESLYENQDACPCPRRDLKAEGC